MSAQSIDYIRPSSGVWRFLFLLVLFFTPPASAKTFSHSVLIDSDNDALTGCTVTSTAGSVPGIELRVDATVSSLPPIVTAVSESACVDPGTKTFGAPTALGGGWPVALNAGIGGADGIELAFPDSDLDLVSPGPDWQVAFLSESAGGADLLGPVTLLGIGNVPPPTETPAVIPTLSRAGLLMLSLLLAGALVWKGRRNSGLLSVLLLCLALASLGVAWAATILTDGNLDEWRGVSPAGGDAGGDASSGESAIDLVAGFVTRGGGVVGLRADVADAQSTNNAPSVTDQSFSLDENSGNGTAVGTLVASDPDAGDTLSYAITAGNTGGAFAIDANTGAITVANGAVLDYETNPSFALTVTVSDDGTPMASATATATIGLNDVNEAPSIADQGFSLVEDSVNGTLVGTAAGSDPDGSAPFNTLSYSITAGNRGGAFAIDGNGQITVANSLAITGANSPFNLTVQVSDGGAPSLTATATITITVIAINHAPSFTGGGDTASNEDAGAQIVPAWATAISDGDGGSQTLTFNLTGNDNAALFSAQPAVDPSTGNLTYTAASNANGVANLTLTLSDDGGTADGGVDTSTPVNFSITVSPVNDAPSFTAGGDTASNEDAGPLTVPAWATAINDRDGGSQTLTFSLTGNDNAALFSVQPAVDPSTGNLTYTAASDANGVANLTLTLSDDGGTADGGVDTSTPVNFSITVSPVNDAPSFTGGGDTASNEDAGAQTLPAWATAISSGPADEAGQTVSFTVTNNNNALFSAQPAVDPSTGNLTYTAAPDANGVATVSVAAMDDGGSDNGGVDTSAPVMFSITVNPVNDPPMVTPPGPFTVAGNVRIQVSDSPSDLLAGATDPVDGPGAQPLFIGGTVPTSTAMGGDLAINTSTGAFSYNPPAGYQGVDSFQYQVCDSGVPGSLCSTAATVILTVSDMVWFLNPAAAPGGDGRLSSPFNDIDSFDAINDGVGNHPAAGDDIFLYSGGHDGSLTLLASQRIFGQGATASLAVLTGITPPSFSDPFPGTGGTQPGWMASNTTALTLGSNNRLRGFDIGNTGTGIDIAGSNFGTLTVSEISLTGSGQALSLSTGTLANGAGAVPGFGSITSTSGTRNISLTDIGGSPTFNGGALSGASQQAFFVSGGTGNFTYTGTIANTTDRVVDIQNKTGGSVALTGAVTGSAQGIFLNNNGGSTIGFSGTLGFNTGTNAAFTATGGGTVTATGTSSTISTTTATAVHIANTTIGAGGVTFQSVNSTGAGSNSAIVLANTGSGDFAVTGDGATAGSGGTISNKSVDAITLDNTGGMTSLSYMFIQDIADPNDGTDALQTRSGVDAIHGQSVGGGLTLDHTTIRRVSDDAINGAVFSDGVSATTWNGLRILDSHLELSNRFATNPNVGDDADEALVRINGITGTVQITNSTFNDGAGGLDLITASAAGTLDMTVQSNAFTDLYKEFGCSGAVPTINVGRRALSVQVEGSQDAVVRVGDPAETDPALGNTFTNGFTASVVVAGQEGGPTPHTGDIDTVISQNVFEVTDHLTGSAGCAGGSLLFNFPQGGVSLNPTGGTFEGIVSKNLFDQVMHAAGGLGQLTLGINTGGGASELIVTGNEFRLPWDAAVQIRSENGAGGSSALLFDGNTYTDGMVGGAGDDVGFSTPSPFQGMLVNVRNNGHLDLTVQNENLPLHDVANSPTPQTMQVVVQNQATNTLDLFVQDSTAPYGYGLSQAAGVFNLYRLFGADVTVADIMDGNGNTGGGGNRNLTPPTVVTSGTITPSDTAPTLPVISIP